MKVVTVNASKRYEVKIGSGLLASLGKEVRQVTKAQKVAVISETNVWPLYGAAAQASLRDVGFDTVSFVFPAGEASKNGTTFLELLNFLAENHLTRTDALIALGGGVVGDLVGFTASAYLRGVPYIQVPTTLLAAVDSSVGGKTAIDLPTGKNLAGAFYQPSLVLCDIDTLNTLPDSVFRDGCAEAVKYGILFDPELFAHFAAHSLDFHREDVIARCVELKRDVVDRDEFDLGERQKLNLGHTIGHGIEAQSHFTISHGTAVAIGTAIVTRASAACGICSKDTQEEVLAVLEKLGHPTTTEYTAEQLYTAARSDKKRTGGTVNLIVPERIGTCAIRPTPVEELKAFIKAGL